MIISNCKIMWSNNLTTILICTQSLIMNKNLPFNNISLQNISNTSDFNVHFNYTFPNPSLNTTSSLSNSTAPARFPAPSPESNSTAPARFPAPSPESNSTAPARFPAPSPARFPAPSPTRFPAPSAKVDSFVPSPSYIITNYSSVVENNDIISTDENNSSFPNNDTLIEKHEESLISIPIIGSIVLIMGLIFLLFKRKNKKNRIGCVSLKNNGRNYKFPKKTIFIGRPRDDIEQFAPPDTPTTQTITPHPPFENHKRKHQRPLPPLPPQKENDLIVEP
jgi:hypothetical protein